MIAQKVLQEAVQYSRGASIFRRYRPDTMVVKNAYIANLAVVATALKNPALRKGAIIECGTWKGGMSAGLIEIGGPDRDYYFFDSFEGLPPAKRIDGLAAIKWQSQVDGAAYYDNCSASIEDFMATIARTGLPKSQMNVYKGFFENTLVTAPLPSIAVLRLDCDWYDSTMACLNKFWDGVLPDGVIIIDDYFTWDGCARAVHDFLSARKAPDRIRTHRYGGVAYIKKHAADAFG